MEIVQNCTYCGYSLVDTETNLGVNNEKLCNICHSNKNNLSTELYRDLISKTTQLLEQNPHYILAKRFGLIKENKEHVVFSFEKYSCGQYKRNASIKSILLKTKIRLAEAIKNNIEPVKFVKNAQNKSWDGWYKIDDSIIYISVVYYLKQPDKINTVDIVYSANDTYQPINKKGMAKLVQKFKYFETVNIE